jgi:hypothetical protein
MSRCPFCDERLELSHQPHHSLCDQLAVKFPNATRGTAPHRPDLLIRYQDKYQDTGYVCLADWRDTNRLLLRVYFSTGRPRYQPRLKSQTHPWRMEIHRDNIAEINYRGKGKRRDGKAD